jgi:hypothetical protein
MAAAFDELAMKTDDGFLLTVLRGVWPLLIWAAHFALAYVVAAVACTHDFTRETETRWLLLIASAAAIAWLAWLSVDAVRKLQRAPDRDATFTAVRFGVAALALIGVLWTTVPIALLSLCDA